MSSMDEDSDTPPEGIKGIAERYLAFVLCAGIAAAGFWLAFPSQTKPDLLPIPPVSPRIAHSEDYDHCLDLLAKDPAAALPVADAWFATGGGDPAAQCLALTHIAAGDTEAAAESLSKLAASSRLAPSQRGAVENQAGRAWLMAHNVERAYAAFTLALSLNPDEIDWLVDRANANVALDRLPDALDDLNHALMLDPTRAAVRVLRGATWRRLNQLPQARADMDMVLAEDPDNADALIERGILHKLANRNDDAAADWKRVIAVVPNSPEADIAQENLANMPTQRSEPTH